MAEPIRAEAAPGERGLTAGQLRLILDWISPLQQALALEADRGFSDIEGRRQRFHAFLAEQLETLPAVPLPRGAGDRVRGLAEGYGRYPGMTDAARRRLVTDTRQ